MLAPATLAAGAFVAADFERGEEEEADGGQAD